MAVKGSLVCAGICNMFERDLKERFAHQRELTYDVQQLFQWMDNLVSCQHTTLPTAFLLALSTQLSV